MKFTVKEPKYLSLYNTTLDYISRCSNKKIIEGLTYTTSDIFQIVPEVTEFTVVPKSQQIIRNFNYVVIENDLLGMFLSRVDNLKLVEDRDGILYGNGIKKLFRSANTTILIDDYGTKYITKFDGEGEYDLEKAVMLLLLKRKGYTVKDIYDIINCVEEK